MKAVVFLASCLLAVLYKLQLDAFGSTVRQLEREKSEAERRLAQTASKLALYEETRFVDNPQWDSSPDFVVENRDAVLKQQEHLTFEEHGDDGNKTALLSK